MELSKVEARAIDNRGSDKTDGSHAMSNGDARTTDETDDKPLG